MITLGKLLKQTKNHTEDVFLTQAIEQFKR